MEKGQPDFIALGKSYGITEITITDEKDLKSLLNKYSKFPNSIIFNCLVVDKENCYPIVNPGTSNAAMGGIRYQQDEIDLLKRHSNGSEEIDIFLSKIPKNKIL